MYNQSQIYNCLRWKLPKYLHFQLTVIAQDGGNPSLSTSINVDVSVLREDGELRFALETYNANIPETTAVNSSIVTASASPGVSL